jgi:hypothetical protein
MNRTMLLLSGLGLGLAAVCTGDPPRAEPKEEVAFPLDLSIVDPGSKEKLPPYLVMFPEGLDKDDRDVRGPLGRLEALRGASKLFPESNKDAGLTVVLRGLRIHRNCEADGSLVGYDVELLGEFNSIKVPVKKEEMDKFLAGEPATFSLKGERNFGLYSYVSTTKIELQLVAESLVIRKLEGEFTFREGIYTYTSQTIKLAPTGGRDYLYRGERAKLPELPTI